MSMPTAPIRLVALDLDGTLLSQHSVITPRTRQAIADAAARGIVIVLATGRPLCSIPPVAAELPGLRYAITSNGAAVWDLGPRPLAAVYSRYADAATRDTAEPVCLIRRVIPERAARQAYAQLRAYDGDMSVFADGRSFKDPAGLALMIARMARRFSTEARQPNDGRFTIVDDLDAAFAQQYAAETEKLCMMFDSVEQTQAVLRRFQAMEEVEVVRGAPDDIEVTAAGVDKGEALLALAARLGIPRAQTLAIGDSENDRAMLQKAGVAAVMANGMPEIKTLADLVSVNDCDHDGVAELFDRLNI